jgi:hypothetical protein
MTFAENLSEVNNKSLDDWWKDLKGGNRKVFYSYYSEVIGTPVSNFSRLNKAINLYGTEHMFNAVHKTAFKEISGDPLSYVIRIAQLSWEEEKKNISQEESRADEYDRVREEVLKKNKAIREFKGGFSGK